LLLDKEGQSLHKHEIAKPPGSSAVKHSAEQIRCWRNAKRFVLAGAFALLPGPVASAASPTGDTVIQIDFTETHDRLPRDERLGIVGQHQIVATLTADNRVSESVRAEFGRRSFVKQGQNSEALGDNSAKVVWHVLGPHQLRRIFVGRQFLMMTDIEISGENSCSVQIKYLLRKGYGDIINTRADNGELAHFSLPKLVSAQCSIH
jgi:hypothetical protein